MYLRPVHPSSRPKLAASGVAAHAETLRVMYVHFHSRGLLDLTSLRMCVKQKKAVCPDQRETLSVFLTLHVGPCLSLLLMWVLAPLASTSTVSHRCIGERAIRERQSRNELAYWALTYTPRYVYKHCVSGWETCLLASISQPISHALTTALIAMDDKCREQTLAPNHRT